MRGRERRDPQAAGVSLVFGSPERNIPGSTRPGRAPPTLRQWRAPPIRRRPHDLLGIRCSRERSEQRSSMSLLSSSLTANRRAMRVPPVEADRLKRLEVQSDARLSRAVGIDGHDLLWAPVSDPAATGVDVSALTPSWPE